MRKWDGRTDSGGLSPEGVYHLRLRLADQRRTIQLPNDIRLDTTAPLLAQVVVRPDVFSPDGDGRADRVTARYRTSEEARAILFVDGRRAARGILRERRQAAIDWYGKVNGRRVRPGTHVLTLRAQDRAGNLSPPSTPTRVRLRYLELEPGPLRTQAGRRVRVPVDTDARTVRWRLAGRSGVAPARALLVRAPQRPGRFTLFVSANGRADSTVVVVRPAPGQ
jgi:hypothetical protein